MTFTIKENVESMYRVLSDTEVVLANVSTPGKVVDVNVPATVRYSDTEYNVVQIAKYAFKNVVASSITIPSSIKTVQGNAFWNLKAKKVDVNAKVIQSLAFSKADIEEILLGECIDEIQRHAFSGSKVDRIIWPDNYQEIPSYCFSDSSIKSVVNIDNVTSIGEAAFRDTDIKELSWPSGCTIIPERCFMDCSLLENIHFPSRLELIEYNAFAETNIKVLNLPAVDYIDEHAFSWMPCLETVYYPPNQSKFNFSVFEHSTLKRIIITSNHIDFWSNLDYFLCKFPDAVIDATQCSRVTLLGPVSTAWMDSIKKGFDTTVIIK